MSATEQAARLPRWLWPPAFLALGVVSALGLAPVGYWFATVIALGFVFALIGLAGSPRQGAIWLWCFGLGYFAVGLRWIVEPFQVEADIYGWMAPFALVLMAAGLALFWGVAGWFAGRAMPGRRRALALLIALGLAEFARAYLFTGFPWAGLAQVWIDTPLAASLAWIGPHGLGLVTLFLAALPAVLLPRQALLTAPLAAAVPLILLAVLPGPAQIEAAADAPILRLVQPNAPQEEKWQADKWQSFFWRQVEATRAEGDPDLVIWPETAIPSLLEYSDEALGIIAETANGTPVVLGVLRRDEADRYYNSLIVVGQDGAVQDVYDKHHLVPFGEYMPFPGLFRRLGIAALAQRVDSGFASGPGPRLVDLPGIGTGLPLICYEAVFPQHASSAEGRPRLLLQLTNDAWFGDYAGPQQHLAQARMRAIEQGLPLARAANTGISAMIDGHGWVTASLPLGTHGFVDAPLPPALPVTLYARSGDWPVALLLLAALSVLAATGRRAPAF